MNRSFSGKGLLVIHAFRSVALLLVLTTSLAGQQKVQLRTGTLLEGEIGFEGTEVLITIDEATLRVPLDQVEKISGADELEETDSVRADRMLLGWLEARALSEGSGAANSKPGQLVEALRLDPHNARIGYWSVVGLLESGSGERALAVLETQRDAIASLYPGRFDQLERRVRSRCDLESGPTGFVSRIDDLTTRMKQPGTITDNNEGVLRAVAFRLVDHAGDPVPESAISLTNYSSSHSLESFPEGYYLYTDRSRPGRTSRQSQLKIADPGFTPVSFGLVGLPGTVSWLGERVARRRVQADLVPVSVRILGKAGAGLDGATWVVTLVTNGSRPIRPKPKTVKTKAGGKSKLSLFPGSYQITASQAGYLSKSERIEVTGSTDYEANPIEIQLDKALRGNVHFEWRTVNMATKDASSRRTFSIALGRNTNPGAFQQLGLHVLQRGNQVFAAINPQARQFPAQLALAWNRVLNKPFDQCDLDKMGELRDAGETIPLSQGVSPSYQGYGRSPAGFAAGFTVTPGQTYVGEIPAVRYSHDNAGEMVQYKFVLDIDSSEAE